MHLKFLNIYQFYFKYFKSLITKEMYRYMNLLAFFLDHPEQNILQVSTKLVTLQHQTISAEFFVQTLHLKEIQTNIEMKAYLIISKLCLTEWEKCLGDFLNTYILSSNTFFLARGLKAPPFPSHPLECQIFLLYLV